MKFLNTLWLSVLSTGMFAQTATLSGEITGSRSLVNDTIYTLEGFVYIEDGGLLFIEPGTIILGDKDTKGTLICTKTGILLAQGTAEQPIVFTSAEPEGSRAAGDWGGVIILGEAPINIPGGTAVIEGGVDTPEGDGEYGGDNPADVSGGLQYVRIEYAGIAFTPGNEINGLTLGGVGTGTLIDHVMVSYCGDDSFEFFGGTVNATYLVSYAALDDDFDTDFGWAGNVQFAVAVRDADYADVSGSNAFESDNDGTGSDNNPKTNGSFSNVTAIGPYQSISDVINPNYKRGAHIKRNSEIKIFNSVITGFPSGIMIDGISCEENADDNLLKIKHSAIAGHSADFEVTAGSTWDIDGWFNTAAFGNTSYVNVSDLMLSDPFNAENPDLRPQAGSGLLSGADFTDSDLDAAFFSPTGYIGAFGELENWFGCWVNWSPQSTNYSSIGGTVAPTSANFTYSGVDDTYQVNFENLSVNATEFLWDFGVAAITTDTSTLETPMYVYDAPGSYEVCLTAIGCTTDNICLTVTIDTGGVQPEVNDVTGLLSLNIYPNPADNYFIAEFESAITSNMSINLYGMGGSQLFTVPSWYIQPGKNRIEIPIDAIPEGVYLLVLQTTEGLVTKQVIIQR